MSSSHCGKGIHPLSIIPHLSGGRLQIPVLPPLLRRNGLKSLFSRTFEDHPLLVRTRYLPSQHSVGKPVTAIPRACVERVGKGGG